MPNSSESKQNLRQRNIREDTKNLSTTKNSSKEALKSQSNESPEVQKDPKYGPLPKFSGQRVLTRCILIFGVLIYVWFNSSKGDKETILAKRNEIHQKRGQTIDCDADYLQEITEKYPSCKPTKCGRFVSDKIVTATEADTLLHLAIRGMKLGGSDGGATILDLHSGALSYKDKFVNIYSVAGAKSSQLITAADLAVYKIVRSKIQHAIAEAFGVDENSLYLTHPTFFSRLTNAEARTPHDEYWHIHVDKVTYDSFHYTSLLYLNDYGVDFKAGRFIFTIPNRKDENEAQYSKNVTVEPRKGRVLMFTSGAENPHFVERVTTGERFAITVSFTCDKQFAINDPVVKH